MTKLYQNLLSDKSGSRKRSKLTSVWISTPNRSATLSRMHCNWRMLMWSMAPAQNFPKNFFAPNMRKSSITNGHKWSTLLRDKRSRFSTTTCQKKKKNNVPASSTSFYKDPESSETFQKVPERFRNLQNISASSRNFHKHTTSSETFQNVLERLRIL